MFQIGEIAYTIIDGTLNDDCPVEIQTAGSIEEVYHIVSSLEEEYGDYTIIHGAVIKADFIPNSFRSKDVIVLFMDPDDYSQGVAVDMSCSAGEQIAKAIEKVITGDLSVLPFDISIQHTYLLVGYTLSDGLHDFEQDEESIDTVVKIVNDGIDLEKEFYGQK